MEQNYVIAALYHFTPLTALEEHRSALLSVFEPHGIRGTILLADEGVNGTIAGSRAGIDAALKALRALPGSGSLEHKESYSPDQPFLRLKVRLKKEIVTMGVPSVDPTKKVGTYIDPEDWNKVIQDPDTVVIDTRNDYEVAIGTFAGAVDPHTKSFREFPEWFREFRRKTNKPKVAMFCTGGIRCEKASSFLLDEGVDEVYHLKGGILKYLEEIPEEESLWRGDCFVFDQRVSVGHGLEIGDYGMCFACRRPIDPSMMKSPDYEAGVSCPQCKDEFDDATRTRFRERQRQIALAKSRGETHLGEAVS